MQRRDERAINAKRSFVIDGYMQNEPVPGW
jgi:hypothetical protein